ncbi:hypothetical protein [Microcoleus sp. FACHB-1515]|nr:hypothetical protein [Microcoleus sp. FACHB-1515]
MGSQPDIRCLLDRRPRTLLVKAANDWLAELQFYKPNSTKQVGD